MEVQIPWLGVILATVASMVVGTIWYSSNVFGKQWVQLIGAKKDPMRENVGPRMATLILTTLLTVYVMAHFINYTHYFDRGSWESAGLMTAFWVWLGFSLTTLVVHGIFDTRSKKLLLINAGNRLVTLLVIGAILGASFK